MNLFKCCSEKILPLAIHPSIPFRPFHNQPNIQLATSRTGKPPPPSPLYHHTHHHRHQQHHRKPPHNRTYHPTPSIRRLHLPTRPSQKPATCTRPSPPLLAEPTPTRHSTLKQCHAGLPTTTLSQPFLSHGRNTTAIGHDCAKLISVSIPAYHS